MARWTPEDLPDLSDRIALVTGANSGLGLETTRALALRGARVFLGCRSPERGATALAELRAQLPSARLELLPLDLASLASIETAAEQVAAATERLDLLFNNAGVMALPQGQTVDGFELHFGTNHLGHFALTARLLPLLLAAPAARIVTTSSVMHRTGRLELDDLQRTRRYEKWAAYSASKLANLYFAFELQRRLSAAGASVLSVAAHPGYSATNLQHVGPRVRGARAEGAILRFANATLAQSAARGAWPQLYAGTAPDVVGGAYYGPRGPLELWGAPRRVTPSARANDAATAAALWERSTALTNLPFLIPSNG